MRALLYVLLTSVIAGGCTPYARFGRSVSSAASEQPRNGTHARRLTDDYIRFGMIVSGYLGRPYKGRSSTQPGLDCSLFTQEIMRRGAKIDVGRTVEDQRRLGRDVPRTRLMVGDLLFFVTERDRVSHVGVYVGFGEFVHASSSQGVIISSLDDPYWSRRFSTARRVMD